MNKVFLLGNIGKDPEVKYLPSGMALAVLSLATSDRYQKDGEWKDSTEWHTVKVWGKQAEWIAGAKKGDSLFVEGTLKTETWETSDGTKKYRTYVNAHGEVRLIPKGTAKDGAENDQPKEKIPF